jgi:hypothetical protein
MPPIIFNVTRQQFVTGSALPWWYTGGGGFPMPFFNETVVGIWNVLALPVAQTIEGTVQNLWDDFVTWFNVHITKDGTGTLSEFATIFEEWCEERGYTPWAA